MKNVVKKTITGFLASTLLLTQMNGLVALAESNEKELEEDTTVQEEEVITENETDTSLENADSISLLEIKEEAETGKDLAAQDIEIHNEEISDVEISEEVLKEGEEITSSQKELTVEEELQATGITPYQDDEFLETTFEQFDRENVDLSLVNFFGPTYEGYYEDGLLFDLSADYYIVVEGNDDPNEVNVYVGRHADYKGVESRSEKISTNDIYSVTIDDQVFYFNVYHPEADNYEERSLFDITPRDDIDMENVTQYSVEYDLPEENTVFVTESYGKLIVDFVNYSDHLGQWMMTGDSAQIEFNQVYQFTHNFNGHTEYFMAIEEDGIIAKERVSYSTHVQSYGWMDEMFDGQEAGTVGEQKRMESIKIQSHIPGVSVEYSTHVQSTGWTDWVRDNEESGTTGLGKRLEAIKIDLSGELSENYEVYYRVYTDEDGWLGWAENGEPAGTEGYGRRLEAIEIQIVAMFEEGPYSYDDPFIKKPAMPVISYSAHVQSYGWLDPVTNGKLSGTSGKAKRMEAIKIDIPNREDLSVSYRTHVQSYGWQDWVSGNELSGTSNEAKRLEAIQIELEGDSSYDYEIYYRVHAESYGWLDWAQEGEMAGTEGLAKRLEAIEIKIVESGEKGPENTDKPFVMRQPSVDYRTHVQSNGWQNWKANGELSGTTGQAKRLEAIEVKVKDGLFKGGIEYRTHVQKDGWQDWSKDGKLSGTEGESKRLEAIQLKLTEELSYFYDIYYRVHAENYGWLGWAKNGQSAGTEGLGKRLESIEIKLVEKDDDFLGSTTERFIIKQLDESIQLPKAFVHFEYYDFEGSNLSYEFYGENIHELEYTQNDFIINENTDSNKEFENYFLNEDGTIYGSGFFNSPYEEERVATELSLILRNKSGQTVKYEYTIDEQFIEQIKNKNDFNLSEFKDEFFYEETNLIHEDFQRVLEASKDLNNKEDVMKLIDDYHSIGSNLSDSYVVNSIIYNFVQSDEGFEIHTNIKDKIVELEDDELLIHYANQAIIRSHEGELNFVNDIYDIYNTNMDVDLSIIIERINNAAGSLYNAEDVIMMDGVATPIRSTQKYLLEEDTTSQEKRLEKLSIFNKELTVFTGEEPVAVRADSHEVYSIELQEKDFIDYDVYIETYHLVEEFLTENDYYFDFYSSYESMLYTVYTRDTWESVYPEE